MDKTFVLDTNVLLYDALSLTSFGNNRVVIPFPVLNELDQHKTRRDEVGRNARTVIRKLDEIRIRGNITLGISLNENGGVLSIVGTEFRPIDAISVDDAIIDITKEIQQAGNDVCLVTKDINVRVKCDALQIKCEDYVKYHVADDIDGLYKGSKCVDSRKDMIDSFYKTGLLQIEDDSGLFPNQFIIAKSSGDNQSALARFIEHGHPARQLVQSVDAWGLKARNKEQQFALDLLNDDSVSLVTMVGAAGTGKTLLAAAAGIQQVIEEKKFKKLIIIRPVCPVGKDIGFLPGTMEEKLEPWVAPVMDNLKFLFGSHGNRNNDDTMLRMYIERGLIEVEAMTYIRGRSIPNAFIIIDECQNLTAHELKTIVTRVGYDSKIVLTGDIEQIDNSDVDSVSNGLAYAVEKFKEYSFAGHITLIKGERSKLATIASKIL